MNKDLEVIQVHLEFQVKQALKVNKDLREIKALLVLQVLKAIKAIHLFIQTLLKNN